MTAARPGSGQQRRGRGGYSRHARRPPPSPTDRLHASSIASLYKIGQERALPRPCCMWVLLGWVTCLPALPAAFPSRHLSKTACGPSQVCQDKQQSQELCMGQLGEQRTRMVPHVPPVPGCPCCGWDPRNHHKQRAPASLLLPASGQGGRCLFSSFWSGAGAVRGAGAWSSGQQASHPLSSSRTPVRPRCPTPPAPPHPHLSSSLENPPCTPIMPLPCKNPKTSPFWSSPSLPTPLFNPVSRLHGPTGSC